MPLPRWAGELAFRVAADESRRWPPNISWRRRKRPVGWHPDSWKMQRMKFSTGHCKHNGSITITASGPRHEQVLVLLHEMAHWLLPHGEHHGSAFWDKAWELYRRYGVPIRYAKQREGNYRKGALAAYRRSR